MIQVLRVGGCCARAAQRLRPPPARRRRLLWNTATRAGTGGGSGGGCGFGCRRPIAACGATAAVAGTAVAWAEGDEAEARRKMEAAREGGEAARKSGRIVCSMEHRYHHPWDVVVRFVDETKRKGPPDDLVELEMQGDWIFDYHITMKWFVRIVLPSPFIWRDEVEQDNDAKVRRERGRNMTWSHIHQLEEFSEWRVAEDNPEHTYYTKTMVIDIPWGPEWIIRKTMDWYLSKSKHVRELEDNQLYAYEEELGMQGSGGSNSNNSSNTERPAAAVTANNRQ